MAKDSSLSKCQETVLGCSIRPEKALTNDGFRLRFDVVCTGFLPDHDQVRIMSKALQKTLSNQVNWLIAKKSFENSQKELF